MPRDVPSEVLSHEEKMDRIYKEHISPAWERVRFLLNCLAVVVPIAVIAFCA